MPTKISSVYRLRFLLPVLVIVASAVFWFFAVDRPRSDPRSVDSTADVDAIEAAASNQVRLPRESWPAAGVAVAPARAAPLAQSTELTGKISLNEDRVAHVFPLVEGRVEEVLIRFGDKVEKDQLLVVVHSREVGQAMLQLVQDRLLRDFAVAKNKWTQELTANVLAMLDLMRRNTDVAEVEGKLKNRPMGEYRERLMSAYIADYRAEKQLERLAPLTADGAVTGKQLLEAQAESNATRAALQSLIEQIQNDAPYAARESQQHLLELQTRVAVDETNLRILGFRDEDLKTLDPTAQGEALSHYPIRAPFSGTIISKDVVLFERVAPEHQILSIADLSKVWVTTDIYEEHLPLLKRLDGRRIRLRSKAWPGTTFEARIFYSGDIVDETTRTIAMRAEADNPDGLLKPGMFVNVELPAVDGETVVQVSPSAVQHHEGRFFVFVAVADGVFARRDVEVGIRTNDAVEITSGLRAGEQVVVSGGFILKSQLLVGLLEE